MSGNPITGPAEPAPWTKRTSLVLAALILGSGFLLAGYVHPYFDATNDGAVYILTAQSMLDGEGYSYLGRPMSLRPPGYSMILLPVLAAFGLDFYLLNMVTATFGVACVVLLFVHLRPRLGTAVSFAVAAAVWLNPGFEQLATQVMSDVPGAALMLLCFVVERWGRKNPSWKKELLLGICIAAAAYVRTVFVLILPAVLIFRLAAWWRARRESSRRGRERREDEPLAAGMPARQGLRGAAVLAATVVVLMAPWQVRNAMVRFDGPTEHTWNYSYWVSMWHTDRGDPNSPTIGISELRRTVKRRIGELLTVLGARMQTHHPGLPRTLIGLAGILCWILVLIRRREPAELFGVVLLIVLGLYYSSRPRLALPVYLIMFPAVVDVLMQLFRRIPIRGADMRKVSAALAAAIVVVIVVLDLDPGSDQVRIMRKHQRFTELARHMQSDYPPDTTFAARFGGIYSIYLGRSVYSYGPACRRGGVEGTLHYVEKYGIETLLVNEQATQHCALPEYLESHAVRIDPAYRPLLLATLPDSPSGRMDLAADPAGEASRASASTLPASNPGRVGGNAGAAASP